MSARRGVFRRGPSVQRTIAADEPHFLQGLLVETQPSAEHSAIQFLPGRVLGSAVGFEEFFAAKILGGSPDALHALRRERPPVGNEEVAESSMALPRM